jgi:hypothetical protein
MGVHGDQLDLSGDSDECSSSADNGGDICRFALTTVAIELRSDVGLEDVAIV